MTRYTKPVSVELNGETYFQRKPRCVSFAYPDQFEPDCVEVNVYYGKKRQVYFALPLDSFLTNLEPFIDQIKEKKRNQRIEQLEFFIDSLRGENEYLKEQLKTKKS